MFEVLDLTKNDLVAIRIDDAQLGSLDGGVDACSIPANLCSS